MLQIRYVLHKHKINIYSLQQQCILLVLQQFTFDYSFIDALTLAKVVLSSLFTPPSILTVIHIHLQLDYLSIDCTAVTLKEATF